MINLIPNTTLHHKECDQIVKELFAKCDDEKELYNKTRTFVKDHLNKWPTARKEEIHSFFKNTRFSAKAILKNDSEIIKLLFVNKIKIKSNFVLSQKLKIKVNYNDQVTDISKVQIIINNDLKKEVDYHTFIYLFKQNSLDDTNFFKNILTEAQTFKEDSVTYDSLIDIFFTFAVYSSNLNLGDSIYYLMKNEKTINELISYLNGKGYFFCQPNKLLFEHNITKENLHILLKFCENSTLDTSVKGGILCSDNVFSSLCRHSELLDKPNQKPPSEPVLNFYLNLLMQHKTFWSATLDLLFRMSERSKEISFDLKASIGFRFFIRKHISEMNPKWSTLWNASEITEHDYKAFSFLLKIGYNFNKNTNEENYLLFTKLASLLPDELVEDSLKNQKNYALNVLEYHCRSPLAWTNCRKKMAQAGLNIGLQIPYSSEASLKFGDNNFLKSQFIALLHHYQFQKEKIIDRFDIINRLLLMLSEEEKMMLTKQIESREKQPEFIKTLNNYKDPLLRKKIAALLCYPRNDLLTIVLHDFLGKEKEEISLHELKKDRPDIYNRLKKYQSPMRWSELKYLIEDSKGIDLLDPIVKQSPDKMLDIISLGSELLGGKISNDALMVIPGAPLASLAISLLCIPDTSHSERADALFFSLLQSFQSPEHVAFVNYLFLHPDIMSKLISKHMYINGVEIDYNGIGTRNMTSTFSDLIRAITYSIQELKHLPKVNSPEYQKIDQVFSKALIAPQTIKEIRFSENVSILPLNRSIGFIKAGEENDPNAEIEVIKVKHKKRNREETRENEGRNEDYIDFARELSVTQFFKQNEKEYKGSFTTFKGAYFIENLPEKWKNTLKNFDNGKDRYFLHYTGLRNHFSYLQNVNSDEHTESRFRCLHDATTMISKGILPDLAPLFHHIKDNRRYSMLIDLYREKSQLAGRLQNIFDQTRYSNLRGKGIVDLKDAQLLHRATEDALNEPDKKQFSKKIEKDWFFQMNGLANILLVDMILLISKYMNDKVVNWQDENFVNHLAKELQYGFSTVFSVYSKQSKKQSIEFTEKCGINWTRMAKQIAFWVDTGPNGYPSYLQDKTPPKGLYEPGVGEDLFRYKVNNFIPDKGLFSKSQDIGFANGPLTLLEFERAAYTLFVPILLAEQPNLSK